MYQQCICQRCSGDSEVCMLITAQTSVVLFSHSLSYCLCHRYLKEQILARAEDPLKYWVARRTLYPTPWKLACKYLCIPASSVPCERIFFQSWGAGEPEEEQTEACYSGKNYIFK